MTSFTQVTPVVCRRASVRAVRRAARVVASLAALGLGAGGCGSTAKMGGAPGAGSGGVDVGGGGGTGGGPAASGGRAGSGGAPGSGGVTVTGGAGAEPGTGGNASGATGGASGATGGASTGGTAGRGSGGGGAAVGGSRGGGGDSGADACGRPQDIAVPAGYTKLVWHDEFDVDGKPSSANWGYEQGFVRNEELQWYQPDNAIVADGMLTITARRETKANPGYKAGSSDWKTNRQNADYTSTSMTTSGKQSWQYGRFEMCAKIPISNGLWPAWWTLGVSGEWPSNGEIDIMEFYKGKILANVACGTSTEWTAKWDSVTKPVDATWAAKFHVWRMDWDGTQISLYVDDTLMNNAKLSDMLNADGKSPFMQKVYMIVNLAIGGQNGGDPSGTTFPQAYQIDNLRVFQ